MSNTHFVHSSQRNVRQKEIEGLVANLETYQTSRVAREFYEGIRRLFREQGVSKRFSLFGDVKYVLDFETDPTEKYRLGLFRGGISIVGYAKFDSVSSRTLKREVKVVTSPALFIENLNLDIFFEGANPFQQQPVIVYTNGVQKRILYASAHNRFGRSRPV